MSMKNRTKATAKNLEGKIQEAVGDATGDPKTKMEGQEKQAEAQVTNVIEDAKDEVRKAVD